MNQQYRDRQDNEPKVIALAATKTRDAESLMLMAGALAAAYGALLLLIG